MDVFEHFVRDFEIKINQLCLAEMAVKVAREIDSLFVLFLYLSRLKGRWLFCNILIYRSTSSPRIPYFAITNWHKNVKRGPCSTSCIYCTCKTSVWWSWRDEIRYGCCMKHSQHTWGCRQWHKCSLLWHWILLLQGRHFSKFLLVVFLLVVF